MKKIIFALVCATALIACNSSSDSPSTGSDTTGKMSGEQPQAEFADAKYTSLSQEALTKFASGDIDGWMNYFSDNAVILLSAGDSMVGKSAITTYWKDRRANVVDSINVSNDIWLPMKVNRPQKGPDIPGVWVLNWHQVDAKYRTGKKLTFWVHSTYHYDNNDKIDRLIQYYDRAPINAATAK